MLSVAATVLVDVSMTLTVGALEGPLLAIYAFGCAAARPADINTQIAVSSNLKYIQSSSG